MTDERSIRVAMAGARGRTGSVVSTALRHAPGVEFVASLVRAGAATSNGEFADLKGLANQTSPDVLVDFTIFPDSKRIALQAISLGIRPVIGTSGYGPGDVEDLRTAARRAKIGAVYAPNFSIGAILMMRFAKTAAPYFSHAEIVETHHAGKKDAPSGTALATAELITAAGGVRRREPTEQLKAPGARGAEIGGVGIHSLRLPGAIGTHEITFANDDETLVIRHAATRAAFVGGVLKAVRAVGTLDHLALLEELT